MGFRIMVSPSRGQVPHFPPLAGQGSPYGLTLDEAQSHLRNLGKPLNSMNLDELLKGVIAAEQNQVMQDNHQMNGVHASSSSSTSFFPLNYSLNRTLSRKTVDELYREIVQQEQGNVNGDGSMQRQPELGETTLEDFLFRTGAINSGNQNVIGGSQPLVAVEPMVVASQQADWLQFQMATAQQQQQMSTASNLPVAVSMFGNPVIDVGFSENQLALSMPLPMVTASSSDSQTAVEIKQRFSDETMEKAIEKRQKRMIKNRESAARSRARKQAYTNQLEQAVSDLRKTNKMLKNQKEMEMFLASYQAPATKYRLRRTCSAPF